MGGGVMDMNARKAAAQKRMMDMMQQKAKAFVLAMEVMSSSSDEEDGAAADAGAADGSTGHDHSEGAAGAGAGEGAWELVADGDSDGGGNDGLAGKVAGVGAESGTNSVVGKVGAGSVGGRRRTSVGLRRAISAPEKPVCIVCREVTDAPLGYIGFGQRSCVLDRGKIQGKESRVHLQVCICVW